MGNQDPNRHPDAHEQSTLIAERRARVTPVSAPQAEDVVFDFEGGQVPDLMGLTMVLTARMVADRFGCRVGIDGFRGTRLIFGHDRSPCRVGRATHAPGE